MSLSRRLASHLPSALSARLPGRTHNASDDASFFTGQTVLITGASSGLGAEFARQLVARGARVVLVARRRDRLEHLAGELAGQRADGARPEVIVADIAAEDAAAALRKELERRGLHITGLVNNAGFGTAAKLHRAPAERLHREVAVNVDAVVQLSRAFIEELRAAPHGFLLNMASMAGFQPNPNQAVYGASKAFVLSFTEALWYESRDVPLKVLALCPGPTRTEFFDVAGGKSAGGGLPMMDADAVVRAGLDALERPSPPPSLITGAVNRAVTLGPRVLPRRWMAWGSGKAMDAARG